MERNKNKKYKRKSIVSIQIVIAFKKKPTLKNYSYIILILLLFS
jgi:hypothetical protein